MTNSELRALAVAAQPASISRPNEPSLIDKRAYIAVMSPDRTIALLDEIDFYKRRVELLQEWQSKMRDPERTICCDIIANGQMLPPENAGTRYSIPVKEQLK